MRNTLVALVLSTLLIGSATTARTTEYRQLLQYTGITRQADAVGSLVGDATADNRNRCKAAGDGLPARVQSLFSADALIGQTLKQLPQRVSETSATRLLTWFRSDLAQKIASLEQTNPASIEMTANTRQLIAELAGDRAQTTSPRALALIDIAENTGVARYTAALGTEIEYAGAISSGCAQQHAAGSAGVRYERQLAKSIRSEQSLLRQIVSYEAPLDMAKQFQSLSDAELQSYRRFTQSDHAQLFYPALIDAFTHSLMLASDRAEKVMQTTRSDTALVDD